MFEHLTPTRTEGTKRAYEARYDSLRKRFTRESAVADLDPNEMVANLILLKPSLTMASWRQYKAAVLFCIDEHYPQYEHAADRLRMESSSGLKVSSEKTSGRKLKQVPDRAWDTIQTVLAQRAQEGYRHANGLLRVLRATLVTGLRPNEWSFSEIDRHKGTGRAILRVRNSKHTNGRANGAYRELFIDELTSEERSDVEAALAYCAVENDEEGKRIHKALLNEFTEVSKWGRVNLARPRGSRSVTLYSFRHQFIADAKQTFGMPIIISALVGHNSTKTAFEHYGRRANGRGKVRVYPTPESVEAVQKVTLETYQEYVVARRQNGLTRNQ